MQTYENDNELLYMISQNDQLAVQMLVDKYRVIIDYKIAEVVYDRNLFRQYKEELRQIGYILLSECVKSYSVAKNTKFSTFFSFCLERKIRNQLKSYLSHNGCYVNSLSLDQTVDEFGEFTLADNIESNYYEYQSDSLVKYNSLIEAINKVTEDFSHIEKAICKLKQEGYSYPEIVKRLKCNYKKVDNTMQKFRRVLGGYLKTHHY